MNKCGAFGLVLMSILMFACLLACLLACLDDSKGCIVFSPCVCIGQVGIDVSDDDQPASKAPRHADKRKKKGGRVGGADEDDPRVIAQARKVAQQVRRCSVVEFALFGWRHTTLFFVEQPMQAQKAAQQMRRCLLMECALFDQIHVTK
eukprot:1139142-Pelagomonas_calceolata.AAC.1